MVPIASATTTLTGNNHNNDNPTPRLDDTVAAAVESIAIDLRGCDPTYDPLATGASIHRRRHVWAEHRAAHGNDQLAQQLRSGHCTALEVADACMARIEQVQPATNAFVTLAPADERLRAARAADERLRRGAACGRLDGVPVAAKDNWCTAHLRTTAASAMLADYVPPRDATAIARLHAAGAVLLGKTNMDEFGMGFAAADAVDHPMIGRCSCCRSTIASLIACAGTCADR